MSNTLDDAALERYARHILLGEIGIEGQERIVRSHMLVIGLGGLGSAATMYLASAGVGRLSLVDFDRVDACNLQRQLLHCESHVGMHKTESARLRLQQLNSHCQIHTLQQRADTALLERYVPTVDIVLDCTDNFATRQTINRACVRFAKPLVSASALRFDGQLGLFDSASQGPCYACVFPPTSAPSEADCASMGIFAPLVGVLGSMQAMQALKWVLGLCKPCETRTLQLYNALSSQWELLQTARQAHCPVCSAHG